MNAMKFGGNGKFIEFLRAHDVPSSLSIHDKYNSKTVLAYKEILKAQTEGREWSGQVPQYTAPVAAPATPSRSNADPFRPQGSAQRSEQSFSNQGFGNTASAPASNNGDDFFNSFLENGWATITNVAENVAAATTSAAKAAAEKTTEVSRSVAEKVQDPNLTTNVSEGVSHFGQSVAETGSRGWGMFSSFMADAVEYASTNLQPAANNFFETVKQTTSGIVNPDAEPQQQQQQQQPEQPEQPPRAVRNDDDFFNGGFTDVDLGRTSSSSSSNGKVHDDWFFEAKAQNKPITPAASQTASSSASGAGWEDFGWDMNKP